MDGGGLFLNAVEMVVIENSYFWGNEARNSGGALAAHRIRFHTTSHSKFIRNKAFAYGGAIAIHSATAELIVRNSLFQSNFASMGSAIAMTDCTKSPIVTANTFKLNEVQIAGTVYWLASSKMAAPQKTLNNYFDDSNQCGFYGCQFATDFYSVITSPKELIVENYEAHGYPLRAKAMISDYYGNIISNENGRMIEAGISSYSDAKCSFNRYRAAMTGVTTAEVVNGVASFDRFSGVCIPGGYFNATFTTTLTSPSLEHLFDFQLD